MANSTLYIQTESYDKPIVSFHTASNILSKSIQKLHDIL
jgi:predicted HTH domain antitoxin